MSKDEMKMDIKEILKKPYGETITLAEHYISDKQARMLYNANYRKIGEDEVVISKRQYEQLKKHNNDRKRLRNKWQTSEREAEYWKNRCNEIGDVASKETAREVLQEILHTKSCEEWFENEQLVDFGKKIVDKIENIAKEHGIELEE